MNELQSVLETLQRATECEIALWAEDGPRVRLVAASPLGAPLPDGARPAPSDPPILQVGADGQPCLVMGIPVPGRCWLVLGPGTGAERLARVADVAGPLATHYLQAALEVEHAANELAERYEEINLLYTISEILGRSLSLQQTAKTILAEIAETVGARRAVIFVHDADDDCLHPTAVIGARGAVVRPISVQDPTSVAAEVYRTQHPVIVDAAPDVPTAEVAYREGQMLSVPIMWTAPDGSEPLGVVSLSGRRLDLPFTAGDLKLIAAIATQIGSAIQNARLVSASLEQQRHAQEMRLAHDLQMRLLPAPSVVAPEATVAARVIPAESVGGDFYNLFRLARGRTGVMIGDVSGHGYRAALIMALMMSASAIHAQEGDEPGETLRALLASVQGELETTEMFISAFYAVLDDGAGVLRYANTGHPHAFVVAADGRIERLTATDLPLGMSSDAPSTTTRPWSRDGDLLLLFTDGITDARDPRGKLLGEEAVLQLVREHRDGSPASISAAVFALLDAHAAGTPWGDDLTLVVLRSGVAVARDALPAWEAVAAS